jgi:hypothetical protein
LATQNIAVLIKPQYFLLFCETMASLAAVENWLKNFFKSLLTRAVNGVIISALTDAVNQRRPCLEREIYGARNRET